MTHPPDSDLARAALSRPSAWVLIGVNLGMIYGVLTWGWSVFDIVFLYWAENLVIGAINVVRMLIANPAPDQEFDLAGLASGEISREDRMAMLGSLSIGMAMKLFLVPFFIIHYGGFCAGHGIFIFALFSDSPEGGGHIIEHAWNLLHGPLGWSLALLAASHLYSFFANFIGAGEYRRTNAAALMMRPYGRIVVLHITIIIGGFLTMYFGDPLGMLIVLVILKTVVDLGLHARERKKFGTLPK